MPFISMPLKRKMSDGAGISVNLRGMALAAGLGAVASIFNLATTPLEASQTSGGLSIH